MFLYPDQSICWLKFGGLKAGKQLLMTTYIHYYRQIIRDNIFLSEEKWFRSTCTRVKAFSNYTPKPVSCELGDGTCLELSEKDKDSD